MMNSRAAFKKTLQVANAGPPVFMPFIFGLAARIEQVPLSEMVTDPTYYANLLDGAQRLIQQDAVITSFDATVEAEVFGCQTEWRGEYDPPVVTGWNECCLEAARIEDSSRIPIMLEATQRLIATRGKDVAVVGVVAGPCSLATQVARYARLDKSYSQADVVSLAGSQITELVKSVCALKVDSIIFREDQAAETFLEEMRSQSGAYEAVYSTLFNLTHFYNVASLILTRRITPDVCEAIVKKLHPNGVVLSGAAPDADGLMKLKTLSESEKVAVGLPIPFGDPAAVFTQYELFEVFIKNHRPQGFFYASDAEVPPDIDLETVRGLVARIKGISES